MPRVILWRGRRPSPKDCIEIYVPRRSHRLDIAALIIAFASSTLRKLESVPQEDSSEETLTQCRGSAGISRGPYTRN